MDGWKDIWKEKSAWREVCKRFGGWDEMMGMAFFFEL